MSLSSVLKPFFCKKKILVYAYPASALLLLVFEFPIVPTFCTACKTETGGDWRL